MFRSSKTAQVYKYYVFIYWYLKNNNYYSGVIKCHESAVFLIGIIIGMILIAIGQIYGI